MLKIHNRRYIGSKTKLLEYIFNSVKEHINPKQDLIFADLFAGTGVVSEFFAKSGFQTIVNDILYSNVVAYEAWFGDGNYSSDTISEYISKFNSIDYDDLQDNYFSEIYGGKYFSINDARKIGYIREWIEEIRISLTKREYFILLTSLIYATDRVANTVGHFEHYLKKEPKDSNFQLRGLELSKLPKSEIFNLDANELVKKISADIVYIDPPYNARQYINFYHVIENLARWEKPTEFEGKSMKFKRNHLKSGYSRVVAKELMKDLINNINAKIIIVSYNNTYNAKSGASNNKITEEEMLGILESKGRVSIKEIPYKHFNSGKTDLKNHLEKIYICKVV